MNDRKLKIRSGFTLAEALMAMTILAIVTSGVILPFAGGAAVQAEAARQTLAAKLGADLLEEIINSDFDGIIVNYNGYTEAEGQVKNVVGQPFTDPIYARLSRSVTCQEAWVFGVRLIWVTVSVQYQGNEVVQLSRLIGE